MEQFSQLTELSTWLFNDKTGVLCLLALSVVFFVILAVVLELRTRKRYKNHEKQVGEWSLFDDATDEG